MEVTVRDGSLFEGKHEKLLTNWLERTSCGHEPVEFAWDGFPSCGPLVWQQNLRVPEKFRQEKKETQSYRELEDLFRKRVRLEKT